MCGGEHSHEHRGRGRRFGRRGFPSHQVWVERLQAYQAELEQELQNVRDVIQRLGKPSTPEQPEV